jgi:hypothetical protein
MQWELQSALFGFTQINNAHNGLRLGQALFKVAQRISITEKVMLPSRLGAPLPSHVWSKIGHVTCDNARNNGTMLKEMAARLKVTTGKSFDWKQRRIKYVLNEIFWVINQFLAVVLHMW